MKAVRLHGRGGAEQLVYEDAPRPTLAQGDVMVAVYATGITPAELTWDATYANSDGSGRIPSIPGHEVSGVVAAVGPCADLREGDAVYGLTDFWRDGAAAEYIAVAARSLVAKPRTTDHDQAAAVPLSGLTAWQALFHHAALAAGQRVLIHGAAGGVGTFAVQLARWRGIHVIATASARNADFLREMGAAEVIDYTSGRFEERVRGVDAVLDTVGADTLTRSWSVLRPGGALVSIVEPISESEAAKHNARGVFFIVESNREQLTEMAGLIDKGLLRPIVAEVLPLARAREAFKHGASGHTRGKIVLAVRHPEQRPP